MIVTLRVNNCFRKCVWEGGGQNVNESNLMIQQALQFRDNILRIPCLCLLISNLSGKTRNSIEMVRLAEPIGHVSCRA